MMSSPRKRWDEHSARWKREALRDGMTKARWDSYLKLSKPIKKQVNPRKYARGVPVVQQLRDRTVSLAVDALKAMSPKSSEKTIRLGVGSMSPKQRRWTAKATPAQIRDRARRKYPKGVRNPWWYF